MKHKKIIIGVIIILAIVIIATVGIYFNKKDKSVTDITVDGSKVEFNVDRQFYLYNEDPLAEDSGDVEAVREVKVTLKGNADCTAEGFEGEVKVEGLELGGNHQSYSINKIDEGYQITCMGGNLANIEAVDGPIYNYWITITEDLKQIKIWVFGADENDSENEEKWYWAVNSGY